MDTPPPCQVELRFNHTRRRRYLDAKGNEARVPELKAPPPFPLFFTVPPNLVLSSTLCRDYLFLRLSGPILNHQVVERLASEISSFVMQKKGRAEGHLVAEVEYVEEELWDTKEPDKLQLVWPRLQTKLSFYEDNVNGRDGESTGGKDCAVCLQSLLVAQEQLVQMPCSHFFHRACIIMLIRGLEIQRNSPCPLCLNSGGQGRSKLLP